MRNKLVAAAISSLAFAPAMAQAESEVSWFGFSQITAATIDEGDNPGGGVGDPNEGSGFAFGADRIRIGYKADHGNNAFSKLQVDFLQTGSNQIANIIKDAVVGYDFGPANVQAGMRKAPIGMDFNTSGKKLDIVNRGMEKAFVLERTAGAFVFGGAQNFGYSVFVGNPATRSTAVPSQFSDADNDTDPSLGADSSYGGRLSYDMGKMLHAQASYGVSTLDTSQNNAEDYDVFDIGLKSQPMPNLTLKAEYLQASNFGHVDGRDQTVWFAHGGYEFTPMLEGVVRHYSSNAENDSGLDETMSETYVGLNVFLNPEKHHEARIQLNYILPSGDDEASDYGGAAPGNFHRTGTSTDDSGDASGTFKAMFQTAF